MRSEILKIDFSDLKVGLDALLEAETQEHRTLIAKRILDHISTEPSCTALDEFVSLLYPVANFGDVPSPALESSFNQWVIANAGWSADRFIAKKQHEESQAHGKKGGRPKSTGTVFRPNSRDTDIHQEMKEAMQNGRNKSEAAKILAETEWDGKKLSWTTISRIFLRVERKNNN